MFLAVIAVGRFSAKYMTSTTKMKKWKIYKLPMRQLTRLLSLDEVAAISKLPMR